MIPYAETFLKLFDGQKRFVIPIYQRQYAWNETRQWPLLWNDILAAMDHIRADRSVKFQHFMGAIVLLEMPTHGRRVKAFEVIDGQQRLTTFQLLITALRDVAQGIDAGLAEGLSAYVVNTGLMENAAIEQFKLWPTLVDRAAFVRLIDPETDTSGRAYVREGFDNGQRQTEQAYAYFRERIEAFVGETEAGGERVDQLSLLFEALRDRLAVVAIYLDQGDDPQTIFETLNSRGEPLAEGDLIRNFIFQRALQDVQGEQEEVDDLYAKHWLTFDQEPWTTPMSQGKTIAPMREWMLMNHTAMHLGDTVSPTALFARYRGWINGEAPFADLGEELAEIHQSAAIYRAMRTDGMDTPLGRMGEVMRVFEVNTVAPLVLYLARTMGEGEALTTALTALESYIIRRDIWGGRSNAYNLIFIGLIRTLKAAQSGTGEALEQVLIEELQGLDGDTRLWPDDRALEREWMASKAYRGNRSKKIAYILKRIEQESLSHKTEQIAITSAVTVEHIMPRAWRDEWPLEVGEAGEEAEAARDAAVDTMGNLTLLTQALNSSVSNGAFAAKMPEIQSQSALKLNRDLAAYDAWGEAQIKERGQALLTHAKKIWPDYR